MKAQDTPTYRQGKKQSITGTGEQQMNDPIKDLARLIWNSVPSRMDDCEAAAKAIYEAGWRMQDESAKVAETLQILKGIAGALGVTVDELIGEKGK
jgi:hypothetical protein